MSTNRYFQDELAYLRSLGAEFAEANPNLAPFLARNSNDPDVERLLEGFAFLSGRLRQKLDDELPEIAHSLIDVLWPHYLRPVPSMTIVQFAPVPGALAGSETVPKGVFLDAAPIEGTACRFQTAYPVRLLPIEVGDATVETTATASVLRIRLDPQDGLTWPRIALDRLRLFINAERDPLIGRTLYLWLCRHVAGLRLVSGGETVALPDARVEPVGFAEEERVLPIPRTAFPGFALLQSYFAFPQKFMFVDVAGLRPSSRAGTGPLVLEIRFSRPLPSEVRVHRDLLVANCAPAVNLFPHQADPIRLDQQTVEHRLRVSGASPLHYEIFSIDRVEGLMRGRGERIVYPAFESLDAHAAQRMSGGGGRVQVFHRRRLRAAVTGNRVETWIGFVDVGDQPVIPTTEVVSLAVTCTNGPLAALVPVGGVCRPTGSTPSFVTFRNITPCTPTLPPPVEQGLLWRLVSAIALNHQSLASVEALRTVLAVHDRAALTDAAQRTRLDLLMSGIKAVSADPMTWMVRDIPVRGVHIRMEAEEGKFGGLGELFLFGSILDRFFGLYASVNAVHRLSIRAVDSNTEFVWQPQPGQLPPI